MILKSRATKVKRYNKVLELSKNRYRCDWCGWVWDQVVGTGQSAGDGKLGDPDKASSQVQCQRCQNFINTWEADR